MGNLWTADTIKYLSTAQLKVFLNVIESKRDYALFLFAYRHGLRASEIGLLRLADLDMAHHRLTVFGMKSQKNACRNAVGRKWHRMTPSLY